MNRFIRPLSRNRSFSYFAALTVVLCLTTPSPVFANSGIDSIAGVDFPISAGGVQAMYVGGGQNVPSGDVEFLGKVGIGTASPADKLEVAGTFKSTQIDNLASTNNFEMIVATIGSCLGYPNESGCTAFPNGNGANGGSSTASCSDGYKLVFFGLAGYLTTQNGTSGWNLGGTAFCEETDNGLLKVTLSNYFGGSPQTSVSCTGLCVRK